MAKGRIRYDAETKEKIAEAVAEARKTGTWKEAHAAAQQVGYKGNVENLKQMMKDAKKKAAKKAASAKQTAPAPAAPTAAKPALKKKKRKPKAKPVVAKKRNYDAKTKAAIIKATVAARNAGKKWPEALVAAKAAGYKGGQISLGLFVKAAAKAARKPGRPAKAVAPVAKKRGRPAKVVAPAVPALDPVAANYLASAIDKAIGELQKLRQQYAG